MTSAIWPSLSRYTPLTSDDAEEDPHEQMIPLSIGLHYRSKQDGNSGQADSSNAHIHLPVAQLSSLQHRLSHRPQGTAARPQSALASRGPFVPSRMQSPYDMGVGACYLLMAADMAQNEHRVVSGQAGVTGSSGLLPRKVSTHRLISSILACCRCCRDSVVLTLYDTVLLLVGKRDLVVPGQRLRGFAAQHTQQSVLQRSQDAC